MWAMVVEVDVEDGRNDESEKVLNETTIPAVKSQEGFVRGMWLRSVDRTSGRGVVVFDSEEHAQASKNLLSAQGPPAGAAVKVLSIDVFEIVAEA